MKNRLILTAFLCCFSFVAYSQTLKSAQQESVQEISKLDVDTYKKSSAVKNGKRVILFSEGYSIDNQIKDVKDKIMDIESNPEKYKNVDTDALLKRYKKGISILESKKNLKK